jgi:hypothetical protein
MQQILLYPERDTEDHSHVSVDAPVLPYAPLFERYPNIEWVRQVQFSNNGSAFSGLFTRVEIGHISLALTNE